MCSGLRRLKVGGGEIVLTSFTTPLEGKKKMLPNFLDVHSKTVKDHGHKLQGGKFQLEISGKKFNMRVVRC